MHQCHRHQRLCLIALILFSIIGSSISTNVNDEPQQQTDDKDSSDSITTETLIDQHVKEEIVQPNQADNKPTDQDNAPKSKPDLIIRYHIEEEKKSPEINTQDILQENVDSLNPIDNLSSISKDPQMNEEEEEEEEIFLTPEMEHADTIYHQAKKLINGTTNQQYITAYKLFEQAANLGHIGAKEQLAFAHLIGVHLPMDFNRARDYFEEGIKTGSAESHYGLYFINSAGLIPNASMSKALVHLTFAAADGYHLAQMALAYRYWRSVNVGYSCELALMYYQQVATYVASKITTASGQFVQRVRLYDEEEHPTQNNIMVDNDLLQYYQLLADRGDQQAQYGLGQLYYLRDTAFDKALYYFRLAAENGNTHALAYLGKLYSEKNDFIKQNNQTALQFFQRAAEKGNPIGQAGLGLAFYHGAGVEQSYEKAFKFFQLSADQSYVEGQLMVGVMYYNGEGVKRDFKMAIKSFQAASQSGHVLAYYNLGQMHATGTGVLRSCTTANELFKNVAERGRWSNMFTEAFNLYKQGQIEQAFMMYLYLAEIGYEVAQSNVAYIIDQMSDHVSNIYKIKEERYKKALIYWNRAANQGFHHARVKLGDYYYYGHGTEQNYELAASHYKFASDQSPNPQAMFNLAYMHEKGLGLKRDIHLAKRFYDLAVETNTDAYLPVAIVLLRLHLELFFEKLFSFINQSPSPPPPPTTTTTTQQTKDDDATSLDLDLDSSWDLYLMAALLGLIGALYTIRRQRAALRQQPI